MEKTKDEAFKDFLEKIQGQNKAGLLLSTLQLKYERETAGEDADKRGHCWRGLLGAPWGTDRERNFLPGWDV